MNVVLNKERWGDFFLRTPCVKTAYLSAVGVGGLMFAHKLRIYKRSHLGHALSASFLSFLFTSVASFHICTTDRQMKQKVVQRAIKKQNQPVGNK